MRNQMSKQHMINVFWLRIQSLVLNVRNINDAHNNITTSTLFVFPPSFLMHCLVQRRGEEGRLNEVRGGEIE